jgi:hypothetical protein
MNLLKHGTIFALLVFGLAGVVVAKDKKSFPADDESNLLITQTDRAVQQYKSAIDQEQAQMGGSRDQAAAVDKDKQVINVLKVALTTLKANPQGFNGPVGFAVILSLDDADRNALLCATQALSQSTITQMGGNLNAANTLVHLSQTCMDASSLLYTVSENASSLYTRYIEGEADLAQMGLETAQKCVTILKEHGIAPTK